MVKNLRYIAPHNIQGRQKVSYKPDQVVTKFFWFKSSDTQIDIFNLMFFEIQYTFISWAVAAQRDSTCEIYRFIGAI